MLSLEEALELTDLDALIGEIYERKQLRNQMVGSLYPNILVDEISRLLKRYDDLGGTRLSSALYAYEVLQQGVRR